MILDEFGLSETQQNQFLQYAKFLVSENQKYNLTAITDIDEVYIKHFYDSLKLREVLDFRNNDTFLDVGSGAGFPGIPLKILFPNLQLTIIEPTLKRVKFLEQLCFLLGLKNVELICKRAEDEIQYRREYFDTVTARAVAGLPILLELCLPYVKVGGYFLGMKGANYQEELDISKNALKVLSSNIEQIMLYELPDSSGKRAILKIRKNNPTNTAYPRKYASIKKKHL